MKKAISIGVVVGMCVGLLLVSIPAFAGTQTITVTIQPSRAIILDSENLKIKKILSNTGAVLGISPEEEREKIQFAVYVDKISRGEDIGLSEETWEKYLQIYHIIDWSKTGVVYMLMV